MKTLRLISGYLRHNLMSAMAYRGAFFLQAFGMLLNDAMLLFFWAILFRQMPNLRGWDMTQVLTLYGTAAFGFGAAVIVCGNTTRVARIIASGDLDYYLALPADPLTHLLVSRMSLPAWGDIVFGLIVYLIAAPNHWTRLPLFLLLGALSALIVIAFGVLMGSLAFWLGRAETLASQLNDKLIAFSLYPIDIFPGLVRVLLYTLIPSAFISSVPAELLSDFRWRQLGLLLGFVIVITLAARLVFRLGLRRYESGNLVTMRG
jgi:ABC-2 type transport system permease protein